MGKPLELRVDSRGRITLPQPLRGKTVYAVVQGSTMILSRSSTMAPILKALQVYRRRRVEGWAKDFERLGEISPEVLKDLLAKASAQRARRLLGAGKVG